MANITWHWDYKNFEEEQLSVSEPWGENIPLCTSLPMNVNIWSVEAQIRSSLKVLPVLGDGSVTSQSL